MKDEVTDQFCIKNAHAIQKLQESLKTQLGCF